jgi:riboflavin synthase
MYTGIIEHTARVLEITPTGSTLSLLVASPLHGELAIDQSVAHNGVCLTIVELTNDGYRMDAVPETVARSTIGTWLPGTEVNIERCLPVGGRLDGHLVQGHVDAAAKVVAVTDGTNHRRVTIALPVEGAHLVAEKGSVAVDGIGLTVAAVGEDWCDVERIPRTLELTNAKSWASGSDVNLEYDVIARYLDRRVRLGVDHEHPE